VTAAWDYTRRAVIVVVWARVLAWPPRGTRVNVTCWFGVAPLNFFAVASASEVPSAESVAFYMKDSGVAVVHID
jgi:hypothetical protein